MRRRATSTAVLTLVASAGVVLGTAAPASAAICQVNGSEVYAATGSGVTANHLYTLKVGVGGVLMWDGAECVGASTTTTTKVVLVGTYLFGAPPSLAPRIVVDRSSGAFGAGGAGTEDSTGTDRIDIQLHLADNNLPLDVVGGSGADTFTAAQDGVDLDDDGDTDITYDYSNGGGGQPWLTVYGKGGNDTLKSTSATVTWVPGTGTNTIQGGYGTDLLSFADSGATGVTATVNGPVSAGTEVDTMTGVDGLIGTTGADTLTADDQGSWLQGHGGADTLVGGDGGDTMSFEDVAGPVSVDLAAGTVTGTAVNGTAYSSIERVVGTEGDDTLLGSAGSDFLDGVTGDDQLDGRAGNDVMMQGVAGGSCTVSFSTATTGVHLLGDSTSFGGTLTVYAESGTGESLENDTAYNCFRFNGTPYADTFQGTGESETFVAGPGDDVVEGGGGGDDLQGGIGTDTLSYEHVSAEYDQGTVTDFAAGTSYVYWNSHPATGFEDVVGSVGNDVVQGLGSAAHDLALGAGTDTVSFDDQTAVVQVTLDDVRDDGSADQVNVHSDVENVTGGSAADVLYGSAAVNELKGGGGNDVLVGRAGNDVLRGEAGNDLLQGSSGDDTLLGGTGADQLGGGDGSDVLRGQDDGDTLTGGTGDDDVYGEAGNDALVEPEAGNGADYLSGGLGTDSVSYAGRTSALSLTLDNRPNDGASGEYDHLLPDVENLTGGSGSDRLLGSSLANLLHGGAGNDLLDGGTGADNLYGDTGVDTVSYATRTAALVVDLDNAADDGQSGEADNVRSDVENVIGGAGSDKLTGSSAANALTGGNGNDTLIGAGGADRLDGVAGNDVLYARDGVRDTVIGGVGTDRAQVDAVDVRSTVEQLF